MNCPLRLSALVASAVALLLALDAGAAPTKVALLPLESRDVNPVRAAKFSDALAAELTHRPSLSVIRPGAISGAPCTDTSCLQRLGRALGVDLTVSGSISQLGSNWILVVQTFDPRRAEVVRRHLARIPSREPDALLGKVLEVANNLFPESARVPQVEVRREQPAVQPVERRSSDPTESHGAPQPNSAGVVAAGSPRDVVATSVAPKKAGPRTSVVVMRIDATRGASMDVADILGDSLVNAIDARGGFKTITYKDVENLLGHEEKKARLNVEVAMKTGGDVCTENSNSCLAEIGGAMGASLVISGSLSKLGQSFVFSVQLLDQRKAEVLKRFQGTAEREEQLLALARQAATELFSGL